MIDFIYRLDEVIPHWPGGTKWSLNEISERTATSIPHVLQYISEGLNKEVDVAGTVSIDEAKDALTVLKKRMRQEIEERERLQAEKRALAIDAYGRLSDKVRLLQEERNWHQAFRTLSYFAGQHEEDLPRPLLVTICSDAVRAGIKSKANMQELGQWLQKAVAVAMSNHSKEGVEEALDLMDAYGEFFLNEESGKGAQQLGLILAALEEPAARYELWEQYKDLVDQLYP